MLESLINPKRAEKGPWKMFFIGLLYASLSILLVQLFFSKDPILSKSSGILVVTFSVMFSLPFMYYIIKQEEKEDEEIVGFFGVWKTHSDAVLALMWLFLGFIIAFSFWYVILQNSNLFNSQIETYCMINNPGNVNECVQQYGFSGTGVTSSVSAGMTNLLSIIENNTYVMIFTLILSIIFGAGAIFILAWNASVIAAAIGIFTSYKIAEIPLGILRYMIHGFPEIAAYFVAALAGGMLGTGLIRHGIKNRKFLRVIQNVVIMLFIAIILLVIASIMEVYLTPVIFS